MDQVLKILYLEDSETDCELARHLLQREGIECEILRVDSALELVEAMKNQPVDLILADNSLPGFSGLAALELARKHAPQVPFIFVSGTLFEETAIESLRNGATDYVFKSHLTRLGPSVRRAIAECHERVRNREMEQQLRRAQQLEAIGTLAGGVAHDFNNILTIIMGHAALLTFEEEIDPVHNREIAETIQRAAERGAELVHQLSAFARKSESRFTSLDLNRHVLELTKLVGESLPKTVHLRTNLDSSLPPILADPAQLERVVINIISNARDALPSGGEIKLETHQAQADELAPRTPQLAGKHYVCLRISDNGTGMDEVTRARIFEPFFTTKPRGKGTGLGMSVVYGLMQSHNGLVDIQSSPGKGTAISLYFPPAESHHLVEGKQEPEEAVEMSGKETILVVEDEPDVLYFLKIIFQSQGYKVVLAPDGPSAVELFKASGDAVSLLFSDIGLPGLNGFELSAQLRQTRPSLPVILSSGYAEGGFRTRMAEMGINGFVSKPYDQKSVLTTVRAVLDKALSH